MQDPDDNTGNGNNGGNNNTGDNPVEKTKVTIWVSELCGAKELAEQQINRFLENHPEYSNYEVIIECVSEGYAATEILIDLENAPDIYCFSQDQISRLVQADALYAPSRYLNAIIKITMLHLFLLVVLMKKFMLIPLQVTMVTICIMPVLAEDSIGQL